MEFNQLRYVCAVAEVGSFSRAAERCKVTQPSLSQQVLKLEEDLGVRLFDRLGRSVHITQAGRAFLPHARAILNQMEAARASVAERSRRISGSVALGIIPTIAPYLLPRWTAAFARQYPEGKLRILEETTPVLLEGLREMSIDIAVLALPLRQKNLEIFPIRTEPLYAVLPKDHPRGGAESISLKELRGESFVMLRDGHCFRDLSLAVCTRARIKPRIAFESGQFSSLLGMVAAGVGVSLVPEMAIDRNANCRYVRIGDSRVTRTIVAAVQRGRSFNRLQQALLARLVPQAGFSARPRTA